MHSTTKRALTAAALSLSLAGGLAACGDDSPQTGMNGMDHSGMSHNDAPANTTTASGKQIDEAFVRQMIPHHQMAVDMAKSAQERADRQEIKDLADEVITAQEKEIAQLRAIAKAEGFEVDTANAMMGGDARAMGMDMDDMGMSMRTEDLDNSSDFDRAFIAMMVPHHEGAIAMAKVELAKGSNAELKALAKDIVAAQETEIAAMKTWYEKWFGESLSSDSGGMDHMDGMDHGDHMN